MKLLDNVIVLAILLSIIPVGKISAQKDRNLFDRFDALFSDVVMSGRVNYAEARNLKVMDTIRIELGKIDLSSLQPKERKALLINAYNYFVINSICEEYPVETVNDIPGFFIKTQHNIAGRTYSLDRLEKKVLMKEFPDKRLHFILNCGAMDCPPLHNRAFFPDSLEDQIARHTSKVIDNRRFTRVDALNKEIAISKIFQWYADDFGSMSDIREFINQNRYEPLPDYKMTFYPYDWAVNDISGGVDTFSGGSPNQSRYVVSSTIPRGSVEIKWFNNLYSEATGTENELTDRASFFTSFLSVVYGLNPRLSVGFDVRYRRVAYGVFSDSPLDVFWFDQAVSFRQSVTSVGPKIRWAPVKSWSNFSVQSAFWFQLDPSLEGSNSEPFLDWNGPIWFTQVFNDFDIGTRFSLFTEIDVLAEDLGFDDDNDNYWSTPMTAIISFFPNRQTSLYALAQISPRWLPELDAFGQLGVGAKYQFTPTFELELLYTAFSSAGLIDRNGRAATYNFGLRYNY